MDTKKIWTLRRCMKKSTATRQHNKAAFLFEHEILSYFVDTTLSSAWYINLANMGSSSAFSSAFILSGLLSIYSMEITRQTCETIVSVAKRSRDEPESASV